MDSMVDKLREYLKNTSPEQIQADWDKSKIHDAVGPTMEEYAEFLKQQIKLDNMEKCYICYYSSGEYDDYWINNIFVTKNKQKASLWVHKFNNILEKWKKYFEKFEKDGWIEDKYVSDDFDIYDRWYTIREINKADFKEIEFRD